MAGASESQLREGINDELLSCTICFGGFSDGDKWPKLLACSHTFCLQCIREYMNSQGKNIKGKLLCPVCRKENQLPKGGIKDLPNNLTVLGLLDLVNSETTGVDSDDKAESGESCMQTEISTSPGPPVLYPSLPQDIEPYQPYSTTNTASMELPIIEADPNKCYECSKPNPKITLKCGHSICKSCKKKRQITNVNQSMCPLCIDLQAASMLLADKDTMVVRLTENTQPAPTAHPQANVTCPKGERSDRGGSPREADRPPAFNPGYGSEPTAPPSITPTRVAPQPPPRVVKTPEGLHQYLTQVNGGAGPRDSGSPPPPPPPRRLPGEILGSPLKCLKKIGSYSDVKMQTNAFKSPTRVSMYENGNFLVIDKDNMTVQVFNRKGEYISLFKAVGVQGACFYTADKIAVATHHGIDIYGINGAPSGECAVGTVKDVITYKFGFIATSEKSLALYGQNLQVYKEIKKKVRPGVFQRSSAFEYIQDVAITSHNDIAVLDSKAGEVYLMNEEGQIKLVYTPSTESCGPLKDPFGITIDRYNNLYVADTGNKRVLKFYANGKFARCVLNFDMGNPKQAEVNTSVYGLSSGDAKHLVMAIHGNKTAEVRLYDI